MRYSLGRSFGEMLGKALEGALLHHTDGARFPARDLGDLVGPETAHNPEEDYLGIGGRKSSEGGERGIAGRLWRPIRPRRVCNRLDRERNFKATGASAAEIDEPAVGNREKPSPESGLVALEPTQSSRRVDPDLRGEILGLRGRLRQQVTKEPRLEL
jgi:hypothetical protein